MTLQMTSGALASKARQWQFLHLATPPAMQTTFVMALRNFTALLKLLVQRWSEQLMPAATPLTNRRALQMESFLAAHLMRTMRVMRLPNVLQIGSPKSKAKACHCEGPSHTCFPP